mgnify:CR=1 FL=1
MDPQLRLLWKESKMARKKKYEDADILYLLEEYWDTECMRDRRRLSYPGLAAYLNKHDIDYDDNALKHRPAVVDAVKTLKKGGSLAPTAAESAAPKNTGHPDIFSKYNDLADKYNDLQRLMHEMFAESVCAKILANHGWITYEEDGLKPEVAERAILHPDDKLKDGDDPFIERLMRHAKLNDKEGE